MKEETYKNGNHHGLIKWYYENGKLHMKTTYKDGKETTIIPGKF